MEKLIKIILIISTLTVVIFLSFLAGIFFAEKIIYPQSITKQKDLLTNEISTRLKKLPEFAYLDEEQNKNYFIGTIKKIDEPFITVKKETADWQTAIIGKEIELSVKISPETKIFYYTIAEKTDFEIDFKYLEKEITAKDLQIDDRVAIEIIPSPISSFLLAKSIKKTDN